MKSAEFKKIVKEAVREAIQDELKDILLEAVRAPKNVSSTPYLQESIKPSPPTVDTPNPMTADQRRAMYEQAIGSTAMSFNTSNIRQFQPNPSPDPVNGQLPDGDVNMNQIMSLMNSK